MAKLCLGCMKQKEQSPVCEYCGYNENVPNYPHQLPLGTVLKGQYTVGKVLGQGGFGITYIGWDDALEAPVAIKEYYPNSLVTRECSLSMAVSCTSREMEALFQQNRDRFLKEARVLAKLQNVPGIVRVHNLFRENNTAYIVMEYVDGINLKDYIRSLGRPLIISETLAVLRPVMEALNRVHEAELVHRDISPDNIMIQRDGNPKLLDFGAAKEVLDADVEKNLSQSTESILKHGFAPIEQYQRRGNLGPWTDVYALCATAYYCLTGKVPADAPERMIEQIPVNFDSIPGLTAKQAAAFTHGMALLPKDRTGSIQQLARELYAAPKRAAEPPKKASSDVMETTLPKVMKSEGKKKKPYAAIAAVLAVVTAVGVFFGISRKETETIPETEPQNTTEYLSQSQQFLPEVDATECLLMNTGYFHADHHSYFTYIEGTQNSKQIIESENLHISVKDGNEVTITIRGLNLKDSYLVNTGTQKYQNEYFWDLTLIGDTSIKLYTGYRTENPENVRREIPFDEMNTIFYARRDDGVFDFTGVYPKVEHTSDSITWTFAIPEDYPDLFKDDLPEPFDFTTLKQISVQIKEGISADTYCICYNPSTTRIAPVSKSVYTQIATGLDHTVVLFSDGTVKAIGSNEYGQCDVDTWTDIIRISANDCLTLGLRKDGTVVAAGDLSTYGTDIHNWRNITEISAGKYHLLGLRSDGTAVSSGGAPRYADVSTWRNITAIGTAYTNSVGLRSDGTVVVKGTYRDGDLTGWDHITAISVSDAHFLGLRSDGTVKAAGSNSHDQCKVDDWTDIIAVGAGCGYSVGLKKDGTVLVQGLNDNGQHEARRWTDIVYISVGLDHIIGVKSDGTFVATGDNEYGECDMAQFGSN